MADPSRPNILLVTTDQQRWDALGFLGQPGYRTPNLDRLAAEGIHFERCYTPSPICTPARISLITGQYATRHGGYCIGMEPVPALKGPTLGRCLAAAGYRTASVGKTHYVARFLEEQHIAGTDAPPPESFWDEPARDYLGFQELHHCQSHTCDSPPNGHYRSWLKAKGVDPETLAEHFNQRDANGKVVRSLPPGRWDLPHDLTQNAWITERSMEFIERCREAGEPWFCMANYQDPHSPFVCPEPFYSDVDMTGVDLGGLRPGEMDDKPPFYKSFVEGKGWLGADGEPLTDADNRNVAHTVTYDKFGDPAKAIRAYIGMCNMLDHYVGKLLERLDATGQRGNTLVLFTSDHGELLGRHGMIYKGLPAYDDNQRVPGIMAWPAAQRTSGSTPSMLNLVDFMPTILEAAGAPTPPGVQGVSQLPLLKGETGCVRDWALVDHYATSRCHQQTFVHGGYKLVVYREAEYGELYDLEVDPDQRRNLFDDPTRAERRCALLHKLAQANMAAAGTMPKRISHA